MPFPAQAQWDCTTEEGKAEAILAFLDTHYGDVSSIIYSPEDGPIEVYFHPYEPEERDCAGWVRIDDECRVLDAEGRSLDEATLREQVLPCA